MTLARFTPATGEWTFVAYPLDAARPGAWIGLSEVIALNDHTLLVLERDNQRGTAARTKKVCRVDNDDLDDAPGESVVLRHGWIR